MEGRRVAGRERVFCFCSDCEKDDGDDDNDDDGGGGSGGVDEDRSMEDENDANGDDDEDDEDDDGVVVAGFGTINVGVICKPCQKTGFGSLLFSLFFLTLALVVVMPLLVAFRVGDEVPSSRFANVRRLSVMVKNVCCSDKPFKVPP